jgi:hypothetical protein
MRKLLLSGLIAIFFSFFCISTSPAAGFLIYSQHAAANASAIALCFAVTLKSAEIVTA